MGQRRREERAREARARAEQAGEQLQREREGRDRSGASDQAQGGGRVRTALDAVGPKLQKREVRDLRNDGYSLRQVQRVANRVDRVGRGAERAIERWSSRDQEQRAGEHRGGGGGGGGGRSTTTSATSAPESAGGSAASTANRAGGSSNYGTADRTSWLSAELRAVDTFKPDLTPTVYNNYRPADLSGQMRDAIGEANRFIDGTVSSWRTSPATAATQPPRPAADDDDDAWNLLRPR